MASIDGSWKRKMTLDVSGAVRAQPQALSLLSHPQQGQRRGPQGLWQERTLGQALPDAGKSFISEWDCFRREHEGEPNPTSQSHRTCSQPRIPGQQHGGSPARVGISGHPSRTRTAGGQGLKGKLGSVHGVGDSNPLSMNFLPPQPLFIALKYLPVFLQKPNLPRRGKPSLLRTPLGVLRGEAEADCLTAPFVCCLVSFPLV